MVAFPLQEDITSKIKEHAHCEAPKEACGVIVIKKGRKVYIPCSNISDLKDHFIIDPKEYTAILMKYDVLCVVHSHVDGSSPSEHDYAACKNLGTPYLIYYVEIDDFGYIHGKSNLIGRDYIFGEYDCFEAVRDWFLAHEIILPPRKKWLDNWAEHGYNYMADEINEWPVFKVDNLKYGDVLVLSVGEPTPNHLAVYLDNDIIYHHAVNRLSCRENMYPFWAANIYGIYRYEGSITPGPSW